MDNPAEITNGLDMLRAGLYLLLIAVLAVTGHGLWRSHRDRDQRSGRPDS